MVREIDQHRGTSQFTEVNGRVTRRPEKHSKRAQMLGLIPTSTETQKASDAQKGQRADAIKPEIPEAIHVEEGLNAHLELKIDKQTRSDIDF